MVKNNILYQTFRHKLWLFNYLFSFKNLCKWHYAYKAFLLISQPYQKHENHNGQAILYESYNMMLKPTSWKTQGVASEHFQFFSKMWNHERRYFTTNERNLTFLLSFKNLFQDWLFHNSLILPHFKGLWRTKNDVLGLWSSKIIFSQKGLTQKIPKIRIPRKGGPLISAKIDCITYHSS